MAPAVTRTGARSAWRAAIVHLSIVWLIGGTAGCTSEVPTDASSAVTLNLGFATAPNESGDATGVEQLISELTTESLVRTRPDGNHEAQLSTSWTSDAMGRRLVFHLREGVAFHDGSALTSEGVKAALDIARREQLGAFPMLRDIERIETDGPLHVVLHLRTRSTMLLDDLGVKLTKVAADGRRIGTGPFMLEGDGHGRRLRANPNYYLGRPLIDLVEIRTYSGLRTAWVAMMRGEIDFLYEVPMKARDFMARETRAHVVPLDRPFAHAVVFNVRRPVFSDPDVRLALNHAIDRSAVINLALRGYGPAASGIWPRHWVYGGVDRLHRYDPQLADTLLTRAGYPYQGSPATPDAMPARLRFSCLVFFDYGPSESLALVVQKQLYDIGVDMRIEPAPSRELPQRLAAGDFDAVLLPRHTGMALSRLYVFWHSSQGPDSMGYRSADAALDALLRAAGEAEMTAAARALQDALYEDPPAIFLVGRQDLRAVSNRFEVPTDTDDDIVRTIWQWRPVEQADADRSARSGTE